MDVNGFLTPVTQIKQTQEGKIKEYKRIRLIFLIDSLYVSIASSTPHLEHTSVLLSLQNINALLLKKEGIK